ncbi:hypothetical protein [Lactococcus lactis]|uniref:hypothetical protein n=1 Tax=Lactococcus lactis TaxID=1358 RepID=UPI0024A93CD7|nr:hypothetical protein [Lactococcus lactis]
MSIDFYINSSFFDVENIVERNIHDLENMRNNISRILDSIIYYDTLKAIPLFQNSRHCLDAVTRQFILTKLTRFYQPFDVGDTESYCLKYEGYDKALISINMENPYDQYLIESGTFSTYNIYDKKSLVSFLEAENTDFKSVISLNFEQGGEWERTGYLSHNEEHINKIVFHDNFAKEYSNCPKIMREKLIDVFLKVILGKKNFNDYDYHGESESVKTNPQKIQERNVKFSGNQMTILMHLKLTQDWSIYIKIKDKTAYIGKLTDHLSTKKF